MNFNFKTIKMNKQIWIAFAGLSLGILMIIAALIIVLSKEPTNPAPEKECIFHVDKDANGICDTCHTTLNLPEETPDVNDGDGTEDPSNGSENPIPEVPIDYTTDVENAARLLNSVLGNNIDINDVPQHLRLLLSLQSLINSNNVFMTSPNNITNITFQDNKMIVTYKDENNVEWTNYMVLLDGGVYSVITDGSNSDVSFETIDTSLDLSFLPPVEKDDITYDAETGYFILSSNYLNNSMYSFLANGVDWPIVEGFNLNVLFNDLNYSAKFTVTSENKINKFILKGSSETDGLSTDVLVFVWDNNETQTSVSFTVNHLFTLKNKFEYNVIDENTGKITVSSVLTPPLGLELNKKEFNLEIGVNLANNTLQLPDSVQDMIEEARKNFNKEIKIAEEYSLGFASQETCAYVALYDEEYQVYILFKYYPSLQRYVYQDYDTTYNINTYCLGAIENDMLVVKNHFPNEKTNLNIEEKYFTVKKD